MGQDRLGADSAPGEKVQIQIVKVPTAGILTVRFLGPILGTLTHWVGYSVACLGEHCPPKAHNSRQIWKGYAAVEWVKFATRAVWVPAVLEITENLYWQLGSDNPRGETWQLTRASVAQKRAECRGKFLQRVEPRTLRCDVEVEPAVFRLYRTRAVVFGAEPPFGDRQQLDARPVAQDLAAVLQPARAEPERPATAEQKEEIRRLARGEPLPNGNGNGHAKR